MAYSRAKLSDFYTLSKAKLTENHTPNSSTYLCDRTPIPYREGCVTSFKEAYLYYVTRT